MSWLVILSENGVSSMFSGTMENPPLYSMWNLSESLAGCDCGPGPARARTGDLPSTVPAAGLRMRFQGVARREGWREAKARGV